MKSEVVQITSEVVEPLIEEVSKSFPMVPTYDKV